jgi:hypothetical protein
MAKKSLERAIDFILIASRSLLSIFAENDLFCNDE